jgi:hypothetical protein
VTAKIIPFRSAKKIEREILDWDIDMCLSNIRMILDELEVELQELESLQYQKGIKNKNSRHIFSASAFSQIDRGTGIGSLEVVFKEHEPNDLTP